MLVIDGITYRYPKSERLSLSDVSLSLKRGEILGLLGPNGAGKTTLISHISGLLAIQNGSITVNGLSLAEFRRKDSTRMTIAPQEYAFYPVLTVMENLQCFASISGLRGASKRKRVAECIAFTQLDSHQYVRAEHLSGGLKRRLNLAIALLPQPDFLLLDEPTVGVDPQSRAFLLESVKKLAAQGMGIIYTSHYMEEVEFLAQQMVIIDHGQVLKQGHIDDLLEVNDGRVRVELKFASESVDHSQIINVLNSIGHFDVFNGVYNVYLFEGVTPAVLLTALARERIEVKEARFGRQNLEQLFMLLTHRTLRD